jgi:hypothetical protein
MFPLANCDAIFFEPYFHTSFLPAAAHKISIRRKQTTENRHKIPGGTWNALYVSYLNEGNNGSPV